MAAADARPPAAAASGERRAASVPALGEVIEGHAADLAFSRATISIVLTNPNIRDNPIVFINEAFEELTGYSRSAVIGRNCRFLQGPGTDEADVAAIRDAIERREELAIDLLNYRADGESFVNRLLLAPIFGEGGRLEYFLGIQKELLPERVEDASDHAEADASLRAIQNRVRAHLDGVIDTVLDQLGREGTADQMAALTRRVDALQILYEEMIRPAPFGRNDGRVSLGAYISRIGNAVAYKEGRPGVRVNVEAVDLEADVDLATRVGLLASELMTHSLRHGFKGRGFGSIELRMATLAQGGMRMTVSDDGEGPPKRSEFPEDGSREARIVERLIEGIDASLHVARGVAGTVVTVDVSAATMRENRLDGANGAG